MSAWIVAKAHIDALLTSAIFRSGASFTPTRIENADKIGSMLWAENHKSVNFRYKDKQTAPPYTFKRRAVPLTPVEVLKAIDCLEYQSCEHKGWKASEAKAWLDQFRAHTIGQLPGYNDAPWGIDS
jgi:hypothetical protein